MESQGEVCARLLNFPGTFFLRPRRKKPPGTDQVASAFLIWQGGGAYIHDGTVGFLSCTFYDNSASSVCASETPRSPNAPAFHVRAHPHAHAHAHAVKPMLCAGPKHQGPSRLCLHRSDIATSKLCCWQHCTMPISSERLHHLNTVCLIKCPDEAYSAIGPGLAQSVGSALFVCVLRGYLSGQLC